MLRRKEIDGGKSKRTSLLYEPKNGPRKVPNGALNVRPQFQGKLDKFPSLGSPAKMLKLANSVKIHFCPKNFPPILKWT